MVLQAFTKTEVKKTYDDPWRLVNDIHIKHLNNSRNEKNGSRQPKHNQIFQTNNKLPR